mmetsp:Transcript_11683/g.38435  ORF Transcript_11683/g.38435 Transcript_11683/m.38435 type:complete len:256 (-) Transcript_11683:298-1065(-)
MMVRVWGVVVLPLLVLAVVGFGEEEEEAEVGGRPRSVVFELEHIVAGDDDAWTPRGRVVVTPSRSSRSKMATATKVVLGAEEAGSLWSLCFEKKGVYRVRATKRGERVGASTSIDACDLFAVRFRETLELRLGAKADLLSLSYRNLPSSVTLPPSPKPAEIEFETTVAVALDVVGQIIPVQINANAAKKPPPTYLEHVDEEPALGDDTPPKKQPPKGFFAKYWHVIVPIVLIFLTAKTEPAQPEAANPAPPPPPK